MLNRVLKKVFLVLLKTIMNYGVSPKVKFFKKHNTLFESLKERRGRTFDEVECRKKLEKYFTFVKYFFFFLENDKLMFMITEMIDQAKSSFKNCFRLCWQNNSHWNPFLFDCLIKKLRICLPMFFGQLIL